jgi:crotonobetainyl-CoA:carnitine CoA-transferase CaiB-like acyl-CoA transferase
VSRGCEAAEVPFAPVQTPNHLFDDPHLKANQSLLRTTTGNRTADLPALPLRIGEHKPEIRLQPQPVGAQTRELLSDWGFDAAAGEALFSAGVLRSDSVESTLENAIGND